MILVEFLGPIQKPDLELDIDNLNELAKLLQDDVELSEWLQTCAVAVNNNLVSTLDTPLKSGDKVSLLPPVCGG